MKIARQAITALRLGEKGGTLKPVSPCILKKNTWQGREGAVDNGFVRTRENDMRNEGLLAALFIVGALLFVFGFLRFYGGWIN